MSEQAPRRTASYQFAGTRTDILIPAARTGGAYAWVRMQTPPGCWTPPHRHDREDEIPFVVSGALRVETQDGFLDLDAGEGFLLPREGEHRLGNITDRPITTLVLCTPGGFDAFVENAGTPTDADAEPEAMTGDDAARLVHAAPGFGIALTDGMGLNTTTPLPRPRPLHALALPGARIDVLARTDGADATGAHETAPCLFMLHLAANVTLQTHGHADQHSYYVVAGEVWTTVGDGGGAMVLRPGTVLHVPAHTPHALRAQGPTPARLICVGSARALGLIPAAAHSWLEPQMA